MSTFVQAAGELLEKLCAGAGLSSECEQFRDVQRFFIGGWGEREVPQKPLYASNIGDDHSPFEYSIAFGKRGIELRLLVEIQGEHPGHVSNQLAALEFNQRLIERYAIRFERFERIKDLFLPVAPGGPFSLWHAVCLDPGARHDFKIYLNPWVRGRDQATDVVKKALNRLDLAGAEELMNMVEASGTGSTPNYFSLDLSDAPNARVKVYFQHEGASAKQLDRLFEACPAHVKGDVTEFCEAMANTDGPFEKKPLTTCFSFVQGHAQPTAATFHLPIAHYVANDAVCAERMAKYLNRQGIDSHRYTSLIQRFAMRPLSHSAGIQSYASFRREPTGIRVTAYLSPELYRAGQRSSESEIRMRAPSEAEKKAHAL